MFIPIGEIVGSSMIILDDDDSETMDGSGSKYRTAAQRLEEIVDNDGKWLEYELIFSSPEGQDQGSPPS